MICTAAIVVAIHPPAVRTTLAAPAAIRQRVCLPRRYARALKQGRFVVVVDGKPVAVSTGKVSR